MVRRGLTAGLAVLHEREQEHVRFTNRQALINGALVVALAAACAGALWSASGALRQASLRPVLQEVGFTVGLLVLFQGFFCPGLPPSGPRPLLFGQRWVYSTNDEHLWNITENYLAEAGRPLEVEDPDGPLREAVRAAALRAALSTAVPSTSGLPDLRPLLPPR